MIPIALEDRHIKFADRVARRRRAIAIAHNLEQGNNGQHNPVQALENDILGARCEAAGYTYCSPIHWNLYQSGEADLGDFIDVKGVREHQHRLIVQWDGKPHWAYLLISAQEHPRYHVIGWCWGREAMQEKYWSDPAGNRPAYFVKPSDSIIKKPETLLHEIDRTPAA
jgi:hypothetical protein